MGTELATRRMDEDFRKTARDPQPPLARAIWPFGRLGALVFRLTMVRKSHSGLAPFGAKTRIAGSARLKARAPAGKTFEGNLRSPEARLAAEGRGNSKDGL